MKSTCIGDGVYAKIDDRGLVLTTGHHLEEEADNVIVLENTVWNSLKKTVDSFSQSQIEAARKEGA